MKYKNFGQHMTKYLIMAIDHIEIDTDPEIIVELMERTNTFVSSGIITSEQYELVKEALDRKSTQQIPEDYDTDGLSLTVVAHEVEVQGDAISELGELVSGLLPEEEEDPVDPVNPVDPTNQNEEA